MQSELLVIGHCCHDKIGDEFLLGGAASYAALLSNSLGVKTKILTSFGDDFLFSNDFKNNSIELVVKRSDKTTCFENIEENEKRTQVIYDRAKDLVSEDLNFTDHQMPLVFLCPIADEVSFDLVSAFDDALIGAGIQGWLREWSDQGEIKSKVIDWDLLKGIDILFFSEDDFDYEKYIDQLTKQVNHIVVTKGRKGADIYYKGEVFSFGAYKTKVIDTTGAGDTFSIAYLIDYHKNQNIESACIFAHCSASLIIEQPGLSQLPAFKSILDRVKIYTGS